MELISDYFKRKEFACKCGCGFNTVDAALLVALEGIRAYFGSPLIITSGCRCPEYNKLIGGSKGSLHMSGRAADFYVDGVSLETVHNLCKEIFLKECGLGYYPRKDRGWIHIDTRNNGPAHWRG